MIRKIIFLLLFPLSSWAACPLFTYPENHKLDQEFNNTCKQIQTIPNGTFKSSSMTISGITVDSITVTTLNIGTTSFIYTPWVSYTPTLTNFGTTANVGFFWRQVGDTVFIRGNFDSGTLASVICTISLPSGKNINFNKIPTLRGGLLGVLIAARAANFDPRAVIFTDGTTNNSVLVSNHAVSIGTGFSKALGSDLGDNTDVFYVDFSYPTN